MEISNLVVGLFRLWPNVQPNTKIPAYTVTLAYARRYMEYTCIPLYLGHELEKMANTCDQSSPFTDQKFGSPNQSAHGCQKMYRIRLRVGFRKILTGALLNSLVGKIDILKGM